MLNRLLIVWIVYAGVMGFAVGGSFVAAYQTTLPQHETSASAEQNPSDQQSKEKTDEALARYTWWLTVFTAIMSLATVGLGIATVGLYATGEKQIEIAIKAANAADLSARAAIALELPLIRAKTTKFGTGDSLDVTGAKRYTCFVNDLLFYNHGRTRALLVEVQIGLTIGHKLPEEPIYLYTKSLPPNVVLEPNPAAFYEASLLQYSFDRPPDLYENLRTKSTNLWFYCKLVYLDFMDTRREAGFCWKRIDTVGMGDLRHDATPAYNRKGEQK